MADYKWSFDTRGTAARGNGDINSSEKHFKNLTKIQALVREALQNSLDAAISRYDKQKPVKVSFQFTKIEKINEILPNFMGGLYEHIKGCHEAYPRTKKYKQMFEYAEKHKGDESIPVLVISDENTKGMYYEPGNNSCSFYGYLIADGAHVDQGNQDGGGSNGIGKIASFMYSKLSTVLVSSHSAHYNQHVFQGATILCSHEVDGTPYYGGGFYDCNEGQAITEESSIPILRKNYGSDIIIVGVDYETESVENAYEDIKKNVLLNFWPAIDKGTLIVQVGDTTINSKTLEDILKITYDETIDKEYSKYDNPLPYYLAVKGATEGKDGFRMYGEDDDELGFKPHPNLGKVRLFIMKNRGSKDKIIATRKPLMVIQPFIKRSEYGYSAVVFCEDDNGNKYLSKAEGPAHTKWDVNGMEDDDNYTSEDCYYAKKTLEELSYYINECVQHFFKSEIDEECNIYGLSELLKDNGNKKSKKGTMSTNIKNKFKVKKQLASQEIEYIEEKNGELADEEVNIGLWAGENSQGDKDDPNFRKQHEKEEDKPDHEEDNENTPEDNDNNDDGDNTKKEINHRTANPDHNAIEGSSFDTKEIINCKTIPMSIKRDGVVICRLKFKLPKAIQKASIDVYVATADGKLNKHGKDTANIQRIEWAEVNGNSAEVSCNSIINTALIQGMNVVDFKFPTNNRYRLIIEIYSHKK